MRIGCASLISIVEAAAVWLDTVSLPQEPAALSELLPAGKSALVMSIMGIPGYEKTSRKARSSATSPPSSSMPLARPGALRRSIEDLEIVAAHLAVRMNDLHQPGDRPPYRLPIARVQVHAQRYPCRAAVAVFYGDPRTAALKALGIS
jgi:hypothetical protein